MKKGGAMRKDFLIESLNMSNGDVVTLEKAEDRMEFEALISLNAVFNNCTVVCGGFGAEPCDPMPTPPVPEPPPPTPVPCPQLQ